MKALYEQHSKDKIDHHKLISQEDVLCVQIAALCHDLGKLGLIQLLVGVSGLSFH